MAWFEKAFGASYPVVYAHRDEAEARRAVDLAGNLLADAPSPWLDLGCGQGRHLERLAAGSRDVVGLDLSPELLTLARRAGVTAPLLRADMRRLPVADESLGAVLSLFTAFGYFGSQADHRPVVAEIARVLQPGGVWLLDFLNSDLVSAELTSGTHRRRRRAGPLDIVEERRLASQPRRVLKSVMLTAAPEAEEAAADLGVGADGFQYREEVTLFTRSELDAMAADAGLVRLDQAGDYDGGPLDPATSPRWLLVYGKPEAGKDNP